MTVSGVILAGGRGERLGGRDKAQIALGERTLLQRVVGRVGDLSPDVIVVARPDQDLDQAGARIVRDLPGYAGVLAGMAAGLEAARHAWSLVVACDMPFLNLDLLRYMISLTDGPDIVVPRLEVGLEPLHALYHRRCLPSIREALEGGRGRVVRFYEGHGVRYVELDEIARFAPQGRTFFNINSPEDLARAQKWLATERACDL